MNKTRLIIIWILVISLSVSTLIASIQQETSYNSYRIDILQNKINNIMDELNNFKASMSELPSLTFSTEHHTQSHSATVSNLNTN